MNDTEYKIGKNKQGNNEIIKISTKEALDTGLENISVF